MANVTVKIEGIDSVEKFLRRKRREIFEAGGNVVEKYINIVLNIAKSLIHNISGETAASLSAIVWRYANTVVSRAGTNKATKEECIRANSLEHGHAGPGKAGGEKTVKAHPFMRPALAQVRNAFKRDMQKAIQEVADRG